MSVPLHKIDKGRLITVPVFFLLMLINIFRVYKDIEVLLPIHTSKVARLAHDLLIIAFYAVMILLYFLRISAKSSSRSFFTNAIAVVASFLPFAIPVLGTPLENPIILLFADGIAVMGIVFSVYSLSILGRSFSIIPQARKLVTDGPYRIIRHPLYAGELTAVLGITLARLSIQTVAIFMLLTLLQVYRALQEERLLANIFPEYRDYSLSTSRFIPGLF